MLSSNQKKIYNFKLLLILSLFGILAFFFFNYKNSINQNNLKISTQSQTNTEPNSQSAAIELKIQGTDNANKPFSVTAKKGTHHDQYIEMEEVNVQIISHSDAKIKIYAKHGEIATDKKIILLNQKVLVQWSENDSIQASNIRIDYNQGLISSTEPVTVIFGGNSIKANSFRMSYQDKKKMLTFSDGAKLSATINK